MNIQIVNISELNPAAYNPRKDLQPGDAEYDKLDPIYCDVIVRRYKKLKPDSVIKLNGEIYKINE